MNFQSAYETPAQRRARAIGRAVRFLFWTGLYAAGGVLVVMAAQNRDWPLVQCFLLALILLRLSKMKGKP